MGTTTTDPPLCTDRIVSLLFHIVNAITVNIITNYYINTITIVACSLNVNATVKGDLFV